MITTCTKPEAATRQLNVSINLLFADYDPLAIRTLASAAHTIFSDLLEHKSQGSSWKAWIVESAIKDFNLDKKAALKLLHGTQNYLKHADLDPTAELSLDEEENDHVIFMASLECATLNYNLSLEIQAFQIWYLPYYPEKIGHENNLVKTAQIAFPNLATLSREECLALGANFIENLKASLASK